MVYLDYSATSPLLPEARAAMLAAMDFVGNPSALHTPGHMAMNAIEEAREEIAKLINANPEEIIFTSGGSESNNTVTNIFAGQPVAVSAIEHPSLLDSARLRCKATIIPVDKGGEAESDFVAHLATTGAFLRSEPRNDGSEQASERTEAFPVAIGEVGLDYRNGESNRKNQIELFENMLQLAKDNNLPVIFHIRDAFPDFFAIIENFPEIRGVVHSFSDGPENLQKSLSHGFYIGVNGLATFAPELPIAEIPLDKLLLETDAPFLTPAPFRGTVNEPARIKEICAYVSKLKGESEETIARITTENAERLFNI